MNLAPSPRRALSRLTIRTRLALVYGILLLLAGVLLLGVTYGLMSQQLPGAKGDRTIIGTQGVTPTTDGTPTVDGTDAGTPPAGQAQFYRFAADTREQALRTLLTQGGITLAVVGAGAIGFGWLLAGRMLQPLHRVTDAARRIAESPAADRGLHERIALAGPRDEVKELAETFDLMLARLDHSFDSQRRFVANASHELRTPLTVNRALLEVALYRTNASPDLRQLGETLLEINIRHERLLDGLLLLARADREILERSYVDLADIVDHVTAQIPTGGVHVVATAGEAATAGNPALLERLVQNLVENGIRHNVAADGWVRVCSETRADGTVALRVSNTGPVVPRYEISGLFEPFRRLAAPRTTAPGAGLGLSIVLAITRAHNGEVRAEPRDSGGLVVTVTLPPAPPAGSAAVPH